ncbi:signal peptide peptidase SppA [bacterium]|jgi:protease IV|nr:signal peptide peptidase SppA [bacterium]
MNRVFSYIKNIFFILVILSIAPKLIEILKNEYLKNLEQNTKVGYLPIKEFLSSSHEINKNIKQLFKDSEIKAIFIEMDCSGGANGTGKALFDEIRTLKKEYPKPVVVYTENVCASAGYWVACSADCIVASGCALVGSIGVFIPYQFKLKNFINKHEIQYNVIKAGKYKDVGDPFLDATPEGNEYLQEMIDDAYDQFVKDVAESRKLSTTKQAIETWANGKVFTGNQALQHRLIDKTGSRSTAIEEIKNRAIIEGKIRWEKLATPGPLTKLFAGEQMDDTPVAKSFIHSIMESICVFLEERYRSFV